jgi:hypothetical protein
MRYLPLAMVQGSVLSQLVSDLHKDPRRQTLCNCCGARMLIKPELVDQTVRCPGCARWQRVTLNEDPPWRLTATAAESLRRTRSWVRRL